MAADDGARREGLATRLYRGQVAYDFIGRRRRWYVGSGIVLLVSVVSIFVRGLHPSIDFKGGAVFQFPRHSHSIGDVRSGSTKRVAAAVGEGAQVVAALHAYFAAADRIPAEATAGAKSSTR